MSRNDARSKNDKAWEKLFDKYGILQNIESRGFHEITSTQINEFREARLMTKFDHRVNLPKLFADNHLSILPITRGSYVIAQMDAYQDFEDQDTRIHSASFPVHIESIDTGHITSEAMAINCAFVSGILADFLEDEDLLPTVNGRMSSGVFEFLINSTISNGVFPVKVENSQIEIDGGYEGRKYLSLIEAKNYFSDDFLIRQLYYPYRLWLNNTKKRVKPIFLVYSNGIYRFYEYRFQDNNRYNALVLVKHRNYSIDDVGISLNDIKTVLNRTKPDKEPEIAFPQADCFRRVINLCELLAEKEMTRDEITMEYAFTSRQTNYYTDAGRYLGLIEKKYENGLPTYALSHEGKNILRLKYRPRQLELVRAILQHTVFRDVLKKYMECGRMPDKSEIVYMMKKCLLYQVNADSTYMRRASTVSGWINWIMELLR